ncbi:M55 family metallopeptidase [Halalkalicoccus tibetensis]|uniref:M55 family metallopeptidase n=1 Tax=Halalkalicoccus tibetensis TaxID=175632 RepID=A0ABD5V4Y9_9EURY
MRLLVITDLEGVAGIDSFFETRTGREERKGSAMDRLASEVNACIEGIRSRAPEAGIDVWDGHGSGGLRESDLEGGRYLGEGRPYFHLAGEHRESGEGGDGNEEDREDYDGVLFVGQHAMAGTPDAPLCHTYSSLAVDYYKLNGTFVGEFACRALIAGRQGVPTVFLAGDDKATLEARQFVPGIETVATKYGTGRESARHRDPAEVADAIRRGAANAIDRLDEIEPYDRIESPYALEIRYYEPANVSKLDRIGGLLRRYAPPLADALPFATGVTRIDSRTIRIEIEELLDPGSGVYTRL